MVVQTLIISIVSIIEIRLQETFLIKFDALFTFHRERCI